MDIVKCPERLRRSAAHEGTPHDRTHNENNDSLNKVSKAMLRLVGADPHSGTLYCLQLAEWGLSTGRLDLGPDEYTYTENLDAFLYLWSPKAAMAFLEGPDHHDILRDAPPGPMKPLSLAWAVLDQIESRIIAVAEEL
jgi:hypothetical protein